MPESFDVIVIGGGPGGYVAAIRAATTAITGWPGRSGPPTQLGPEGLAGYRDLKTIYETVVMWSLVTLPRGQLYLRDIPVIT